VLVTTLAFAAQSQVEDPLLSHDDGAAKDPIVSMKDDWRRLIGE